jgi:hypothetical protein
MAAGAVQCTATYLVAEAARFLVVATLLGSGTRRFRRGYARAAEGHDRAFDPVRAQIRLGALELECEPHGAGMIAFEEIAIVLGQTVAGAGEDFLESSCIHACSATDPLVSSARTIRADTAADSPGPTFG